MRSLTALIFLIWLLELAGAQSLAPSSGPIVPGLDGKPLSLNLKLQNDLQQQLSSTTFENKKLWPSPFIRLDTNKGSGIYQLSIGQALSVTTIAHPLSVDVANLDERTRALIGGRVLRGEIVQTGQFGWQVALLNSTTGNIFCGGNYVGAGWIITAAHCFRDSPTRETLTKDDFIVLYGTLRLISGGQRAFPISDPLLHEKYDPVTLANDIALVRIQAPNNLEVAPIATDDDAQYLSAQRKLVVTGWGQTTDGGNISIDLLQAVVPVADFATCKASYAKLFPVADSQFCAGATSQSSATASDTCKGDSGGPISYVDVANNKRVVLGLTSFGEGCGHATRPGVYTRLRSHLDWIEGKTGQKVLTQKQ